MSSAPDVDVLFTPITVAGRTLRNRLVSVPHGNSYGRDGIPSASHVAYIRRIAETTVGLVVIGATAIHETTYRPPLFSLFDDRALPRLREMVDAAHDGGARIVSQLGHSGRHAPVSRPGVVTWAPSPLPLGPQGERYAPMSDETLEELRRAYVVAAQHALDAGFDGVEIHAAHGYLMQQFLSPYYNRREDGYGGELDGRMRLLVEVLERVREAARGGIVSIRLGAGDDRAGGLEWPEVLRVARRIDRAGLVDYISLAVPAQKSRYVKDGAYPRAGLRAFGGELRRSVRVPVIVSQRMDAPELAADVVRSGDADLIGLARELVADPEWGTKAQSRATSLIRPCVLCLQGCRQTADALANGAVSCDVNPTAYGIEPDVATPARRSTATTVVIVGGGPAGCEAALAAARRGRPVVLFERAARLGGRARLAGNAPVREMWARYADSLEAMLRATANVEVCVHTAASADAIRAIGPSLVVIAAGATMRRPASADHSTEELLAFADLPKWQRAVVLDPFGRWDAINAVERLVSDGTRVHYVTALERVAAQVPEESRDGVIARLRRGGVRITVGADLSTVPPDDADVRIASGELVPNALSLDLPAGCETVSIGDCVAPRGIALATREGWSVGRLLA